MLFSLRPLLVHLLLPLAVGSPWCQALASLSTVTTAAHRAAEQAGHVKDYRDYDRWL